MHVPRAFSAICLALLASFPLACAQPEATAAPVTISIAGSTALEPLLKESAKRYMEKHANVTIQVSGGGSQAGLSKVAAGEVTFGASDIASDDPQLEDNRIAVVGLAAMAHKGNYDRGIGSLARDEIRDIFTGAIKNWSELGGDDQPIVVLNREKTSGTRAAFGALTLGGDRFVAGEELDSSGKVQTALKERPGAISYLALSYRNDSIMTFDYDGVAPTPDNIMINKYPLWAYEHLYTRGKPSETALDFIAFVTSGRFQRDALPPLGFIALHDMRVVRDK